MQFEKREYEACIADCKRAIERGRELRADYKLVGRALTRQGTALARLDRLEEAVEIYQKALTEHRCWPLCHHRHPVWRPGAHAAGHCAGQSDSAGGGREIYQKALTEHGGCGNSCCLPRRSHGRDHLRIHSR